MSASTMRRHLLLIEGYHSNKPTLEQQIAILETLIWPNRLDEAPGSLLSTISSRAKAVLNSGKKFSLQAAQAVYQNALAKLQGASPQAQTTAATAVKTGTGNRLNTVGSLLMAATVIASVMAMAPNQAQAQAAGGSDYDAQALQQIQAASHNLEDMMKEFDKFNASQQKQQPAAQTPAAKPQTSHSSGLNNDQTMHDINNDMNQKELSDLDDSIKNYEAMGNSPEQAKKKATDAFFKYYHRMPGETPQQ